MSDTAVELRTLLDEREVEWKENFVFNTMTVWEANGMHCSAIPIEQGTVDVVIKNLTPAQAVAVTLGAETCHMEQVQHYYVSKHVTSWGCVCSSCGAFHEFTHGEGWKYCPICGAKVVDE